MCSSLHASLKIPWELAMRVAGRGPWTRSPGGGPMEMSLASTPTNTAVFPSETVGSLGRKDVSSPSAMSPPGHSARYTVGAQ